MIRTPYLVLFIFLGAIAIGTASALITITLAGDVIIEGDLDMTNGKISNLVTPSVPADAATKGYVDSAPRTDTLALLECTADQVARWDGNIWICNSISVEKLPLILDSTDNVGLYTSLAVVNGKPAISYHDANYGDLKYVRADDADGIDWFFTIIYE